MIAVMHDRGFLQSDRVEQAFRAVPRHLFAPEVSVDSALQDDTAPQPAEPPREISGRTEHGEQRAQGRDGHGASDEAMNAVENPVKGPKEQSGGTFRYDGEDATVVLNPEGKVVTTWARNSNGWRHS